MSAVVKDFKMSAAVFDVMHKHYGNMRNASVCVDYPNDYVSTNEMLTFVDFMNVVMVEVLVNYVQNAPYYDCRIIRNGPSLTEYVSSF